MARITNLDDLLFPVELRPLYTEIELNGKSSRIEVPNNRIVVNNKSGIALGVVSCNYKLITNHEAVELGKKCCRELFGAVEADNIEIFNIDAPSTASYCHIDLVHKDYVMNLFGEKERPEVYIPYIRITNSYNTSRALSFDIGFCRKICLNGVIFESETIKFTFSHVKHELNRGVSFSLEHGSVKALFDKFVLYTKKLRAFSITEDNSMRLIITLFSIKEESEIDANDKKADIIYLVDKIKQKLKTYVQEFGETGYSLFNVITDIASHPIDNRYFHRDTNSMQRLAGNWINSFQKEIQKTDFNIETYLQLLKESPNKALHLTANRYAVDGR